MDRDSPRWRAVSTAPYQARWARALDRLDESLGLLGPGLVLCGQPIGFGERNQFGEIDVGLCGGVGLVEVVGVR